MKNFKSYYKLPAEPNLVYQAFTNPFTLELWTDEKAVMSTEPGSLFSWFDGEINGINLRFEENTIIEQEWFFGENAEKSIVTIKLHADKKGTSVELRHSNIPDEAYEDIVEGWNEVVFATLKDYYCED